MKWKYINFKCVRKPT